MFEIIPLPAFKDNYIWLLRKGQSAVLVDPGEASPALDYLRQESLSLTAILITHKHADHQGGISELLSACIGPVAVYGPESESITGMTHPLRGGEEIELPELDRCFKVLAVPGHTLGHLAFYTLGSLFSGDTLFAGGCGRLFEGSPEQMHASLQMLAGLPPQTLVYCAHEYTEGNLRFALAVEPGNQALHQRYENVLARRAQGLSTVPSTLALELETNPFLRTDVPEVRIAAQARDPHVLDDSTAFAALRAWKNQF